MGLSDILKKNKEVTSSKDYRKTGLNTNLSNYGWYECVHCHKKFRKGDIDIDHIIPQSRGGEINRKIYSVYVSIAIAQKEMI